MYAWGLEYNPVSDEILVGDYWNYQVERYRPDGTYIGSFFRSVQQRYGQPYTISVDPRNGDIYVAELAEGREYGHFGRYAKDGTYLGDIKVSGGYPVWAHIDAGGVLWIADAHNDRSPNVLRYQLNGSGGVSFLNSFGNSAGSNPGEFGRELHGVATDSDGNAYIADASNLTVHVYRPNGTWVRDIGSPGTGLGQFKGDLRGVAIDKAKGLLYVVDAQASQVDVFTLAGAPVRTFGSEGSGAGQFADGGREVELDGNGNPWVADYGNYRVHKFSPTGALIGTYPDPAAPPPLGGFSQVRGVAVDPVDGTVWGADSWNNRFQKFDATGKAIDAWGFRNSLAPYGMNYPRGMAVDPANRNIWVVNTRDHNLRVYDRNGNYLFTAGDGFDSSRTGSFRWPLNVEVFNGRAYVTDYVSGYWKVLNASNGQEIQRIQARNSGIGIDPANGWVYVASWHDDVVRVYDAGYNYRFSFGSSGKNAGQFVKPWDVEIIGSTVYVADSGNNRVSAFTLSGSHIGDFGTRGKYAGQFIDPSGLSKDAAGRLYVADTGNNRIQVFDPGAAVPASDAVKPTVTISGPAAGSTVPAESPVTITGNYGDNQRIGIVEVAIRDESTKEWWNANLAAWDSKKVWNLSATIGDPANGTFENYFVAPEYGHQYFAQARAYDVARNLSATPFPGTRFAVAGGAAPDTTGSAAGLRIANAPVDGGPTGGDQRIDHRRSGGGLGGCCHQGPQFRQVVGSGQQELGVIPPLIGNLGRAWRGGQHLQLLL